MAMGSTAGTVKEWWTSCGPKGTRSARIKLRLFRPFPAKEMAKMLEGKKAVAVMDRAISIGATGPMFPEVRSALFESKQPPQIVNYVYGLGGRDVRPEELKDVFKELMSGNANEPSTIWGCGYERINLKELSKQGGPLDRRPPSLRRLHRADHRQAGTDGHRQAGRGVQCHRLLRGLHLHVPVSPPGTCHGSTARSRTPPATISGVEAAYLALKRKGKITEDIRFVAFGGDGATYDIGFQALSGAIERGHHFLYVCLNNEAYMNTGIQRSGATGRGAQTTTCPAGTCIPGKKEFPKDMTKIIIAHDLPYAAQAPPTTGRT